MRRALGWILGLSFVFVVVFPLLWSVMSSFKSTLEIFGSPWNLPKSWSFENYGSAWVGENFSKAFLTSLFVSIATLAILLPVGSMAAYALAQFQFKGSKLILSVLLGGMMFPNLVAAVPLRVLASQLGIYDTYHGLVLIYVAYSLSFTVFVMHGFFETLPKELSEAAEIDGASLSRVFWTVMLPLAKPGLLVVGIFNGIGLWNEYNLSKILLTTDHYTLPLVLAGFVNKGNYDVKYGETFAGLVIVMIPILLVYWAFREKIQKGMLAGAIK